MSIPRRAKFAFSLAALFFIVAVVFAVLWRDQAGVAAEREADALGYRNRAEWRSSVERFENNAGEWRTMTLLAAVLASVAVAGGVRTTRGSRVAAAR